VDTTGAFTANGKSFAFMNAIEFANQLSGSPEVHGCFARNWFEYAIVREITPNDQSAVDLALAAFVASGLDIKRLIAEVVASAPFLGPR
jgi:hypothetical protein